MMDRPLDAVGTILQEELERAVHEPGRLKILLYLYAVEEADFVYLLHQTGLSRGNLSSHLAKLEEAGYVTIEKGYADKIPRTLLRLTAKGRKALEVYKKSLIKLLAIIK